MSGFLENVTDQLNLRWAWEKVRKVSVPGDTWIDEIDLAHFELLLESNLNSIAEEIKKGRYVLSPLRPLPFPKHDDDEGNPRIRQSFNVKIRDQVAWVAVVNVIGEYVDSKMPTWSYGNRLFRSIWTEEATDGTKSRKFGRYRNSSGQIYLPFRQGWPVFRRHVYLTTHKMTGYTSRVDCDEAVQVEDQIQANLPSKFRCQFLNPDYWNDKRTQQGKIKELYWCSIDFEKFYPSINLGAVKENIIEQLPESWINEASNLIDSMLQFKIDPSEWSDDDLSSIGFDQKSGSNTSEFTHIPTGLYVSGFLANTALLKLDSQVNEALKEHRVAHFRYVDDHIILAYTFEDLIGWVLAYEKLLAESKSGASSNPEKLEPEALREYLKIKTKNGALAEVNDEVEKSAIKSCRLDPKFPSPLMTKTLALVSGISRTDFNLLESTELTALRDQLEHLLLVDFPEEEMPSKTRQTFAATRLLNLVECQLANPTHTNTEKHEDSTADIKRIFELIRKVLRERPDRTRLWTRATVMCRVAGIDGLVDIIEDIQCAKHPQSRNYLYANLISLLANQIQFATRTLTRIDSVRWKKEAAKRFLRHTVEVSNKLRQKCCDKLWYHRVSWNQFLLSLYCAKLQLENSDIDFSQITALLPQESPFLKDTLGYSATSWAWWCTRGSLADLQTNAAPIVKSIGLDLMPNYESASYWLFFPTDAPRDILAFMATARKKYPIFANNGWWFEALLTRDDSSINKLAHTRVQSLLREDNSNLFDWCVHLAEMKSSGMRDPRTSEWTALEIIRQIIELLAPTSGIMYLKKSTIQKIPLHPSNFIIPKTWFCEKDTNGQTWTWDSWKRRVADHKRVGLVPANKRVFDRRFEPIAPEQTQSREINTIRGVGLLLYGLLAQSFSLPASWNGAGHSDILALLPKLLLKEMTCSSWTLGILQSCLTSRVNETLKFKLKPIEQREFISLDDDTTKDPKLFVSPADVVDAIRICQTVLERNQLSTFDQRARQLIPVSVKQLTSPDWNRTFPEMEESHA